MSPLLGKASSFQRRHDNPSSPSESVLCRQECRWSLGVNLKGHLRMIGVVPFIRAVAGEARKCIQPLSAADSLNVLVQDLFDGWSFRCIRNDFSQIWIFSRNAILIGQARNDSR